MLSIPTSLHAQQPATQPDPAWVEKYGPPPAGPSVAFAFAFDHEGVPVPNYTLQIAEDGSGQYRGTEATPPTLSPASPPVPQPFDRSVTLTAATRTRIFNLARDLKYFNIACASKARNMADTGRKTLSYTGADSTTSSCTYNYSENKDVQALTDIFQGIAETMNEGRKLDYLHRYDRLGLDAEITYLAQEVTEGRALEVGTIAASLRSIAADAEVIERVRARANSLLALVPAGPAQAAPTQN
jgi:hypothetical protein